MNIYNDLYILYMTYVYYVHDLFSLFLVNRMTKSFLFFILIVDVFAYCDV